MKRTANLDRKKARVRGGILAILPLAAVMTIQAATITLPTSDQNCYGDFYSCANSISTDDSKGVGFYVGDQRDNYTVDIMGDGNIAESTSGFLLGGAIDASTVIPYDYDFTLDTGGGDPTYTLQMEIIDDTTRRTLVDLVTTPQSFSGSTDVSGAGDFTILHNAYASPYDLLTVEFILSISDASHYQETSVTIDPGASIDFAGAPEPASFALLGAGLAGLGFLGRKARRK